MPPTLATLLDSLATTTLPTITLGLERVQALMAALGNPHERLPPVIHVAGTNGKASTIAFLRAMLEAAGHSVHVYSSPELVRFNERIVLAGQMVEDAPLIAALERVRTAAQTVPSTFFEITTAAAFCLFAEHPADILLLETGLGGRLDATNIIARPLLSVITPISMDHQDYLGTTLSAIAAEKAGIIKPGVPCVVAPQVSEVAEIMQRVAVAQDAPYYAAGAEWQYAITDDNLEVASGAHTHTYPLPGMVGAHQCANAATAVVAADILCNLGFALPPSVIATGVAEARVPGRLQRLGAGALVDQLPEGTALWIDGGHNAGAGAALAAFIAQMDAPVTLICGMMKDKDVAAFLAPMAPHIQHVMALTLDAHERGAPASQICDAARLLGVSVAPADSLDQALQEALAGAAPATIVIAGSLSLAGLALQANGTPPE